MNQRLLYQTAEKLNRNTEWLINVKSEVQGIEEWPETEVNLEAWWLCQKSYTQNMLSVYYKLKRWERGLTSIKNSVYVAIQWLKEYTKVNKVRLIATTKNWNKINTKIKIKNKGW